MELSELRLRLQADLEAVRRVDVRLFYFCLDLMSTGLRHSDMVDSSGWASVGLGDFSVSQKKTENNVVISGLALSDLKLNSLLSASNAYMISSVRTLKRTFYAHTSHYYLLGSNERLGFHVFRHYFAKNMLFEGFSLVDVSKALGHTRLSTTRIYTDSIIKVKR